MFITLEGIEGSGKSTQIELIASHLEKSGNSVLATREPGGCYLGSLLRPILLNRSSHMVPLAELHLFIADRAQHIAEVIAPALEKGTTVLCDRYADSTVAYQAAGRKLNSKMVSRLAWLDGQAPVPQLTILLDLPAELGISRACARNSSAPDEASRFDDEKLAFHKKVRQAFLQLARSASDRIAVVDATADPRSVFDHCMQLLDLSGRAVSRKSQGA